MNGAFELHRSPQSERRVWAEGGEEKRSQKQELKEETGWRVGKPNLLTASLGQAFWEARLEGSSPCLR